MKKQSLKYLIFSLVAVVTLSVISGCCDEKKSSATDEAQVEQTAEVQKAESEWISLFNGQTLDGWKRYKADEITDLWIVEDGMILCNGKGGSEGAGQARGSLITLGQYDNFELVLDWKITPGANSGILYHIVEKPELAHAYETGPEYQLLDDVGFPSPVTEMQKTAAAYDMYPASADKPLNPPGEWNTSKLVYNNGHVEHWLNGEKVVEYDESGEDWKARYDESKWGDYPQWGQYKKGAIGLQDHGGKIWFKNIKIKKL